MNEDSASPAVPPNASPASSRSASPDPAAPRSASPDPAAPPKAVDVADYVRESPDRSGNPGQLVVDGVEACLALARTWHAWDGGPIARTVDGKPNTWVPYKALRRITDHLIDHLHQVEALLAGAEPIPDTWHGRLITLDADWSRFTEADFDEACSRLRRLARWYVLRYRTAGEAAWDEPRDGEWTLREIAEHVAGVTYYAEQVGSLADLDGG